MKTVKFAQVLKFSENLVKVDKPEEERYVTVLLYGRGVIEREIKEGKVPVAFTGYKAHAGQLIISTINARNGAAGIIPAELDGAVVSKDFPLFDIDHECVDEQYLLYYLWSDSFIHKAEQNSFGATMPRLHVKPFLNMQMRLPALSEQKRRAHTLCHVESLLNTQSHLLTKLDELVKSRFIELFGDPQRNPHGYKHTKLSDIATYYNGLTYKPENVAAEGTIVLRSSNIQNSQLDFADTVRVDCAIKERLMVQKNDILMCSRNGSAKLVGKVALIKDIQEPMSFGAFMMIIRSHYFGYLMTYFQMDAFRQQIKTGATTTINQITGRMLDDVTIPLPPMSLVDQFATFVEQTDKSKLAVQQSLEKLEMLKKSLMQQYFG